MSRKSVSVKIILNLLATLFILNAQALADSLPKVPLYRCSGTYEGAPVNGFEVYVGPKHSFLLLVPVRSMFAKPYFEVLSYKSPGPLAGEYVYASSNYSLVIKDTGNRADLASNNDPNWNLNCLP